MARVPLRDIDDLPEEYRYLFAENDLGVLNLFRVLGHNPPLLQSYMRWGTALWREAGLDDRGVELVILAVAGRLGSGYEWHQHAEAGREAGLSPAELEAIRDGRFDALAGADGTLAEYAVACVEGTTGDDLVAAVIETFDTWTAVGVALLAGHYLLTARVVNTLGVEPEEPLVGWALDGL